jgi:D-tagatose-1,6-bisphosphate aldolase subunit GatZ/KbaZ
VPPTAFMMHGLTDAWTRVIALVVQPGVEFDHDSVVDYDRSRAEGLIEWRRKEASDIVFEAHSTDYQNADAYRHLVEDGFSILKVGPALTFALREALYSLAEIEAQVIEAAQQSHLAETIERIMLVHPEAWQPYYAGNLERQVLLRRYSYSDRVRYYWHQPEVAAAVNRLIANLSAVAIPESMLSLYLPAQYARMREGTISRDPTSLIVDKIKDVLRVYDRACN